MLYISTGVLCHKLRTLPYFQKYWITSAIEMPTQALENPINILRPNSSKANSQREGFTTWWTIRNIFTTQKLKLVEHILRLRQVLFEDLL